MEKERQRLRQREKKSGDGRELPLCTVWTAPFNFAPQLDSGTYILLRGSGPLPEEIIGLGRDIPL